MALNSHFFHSNYRLVIPSPSYTHNHQCHVKQFFPKHSLPNIARQRCFTSAPTTSNTAHTIIRTGDSMFPVIKEASLGQLYLGLFFRVNRKPEQSQKISFSWPVFVDFMKYPGYTIHIHIWLSGWGGTVEAAAAPFIHFIHMWPACTAIGQQDHHHHHQRTKHGHATTATILLPDRGRLLERGEKMRCVKLLLLFCKGRRIFTERDTFHLASSRWPGETMSSSGFATVICAVFVRQTVGAGNRE